MLLGDSPEVVPLEILRVSFLLGNGQEPSDIPLGGPKVLNYEVF